MYSITLRFYDLDINLQSDNVVVVDRIGSLYHHFLVDKSTSSARFRSELMCFSSPDGSSQPPSLILDGIKIQVEEDALCEMYVNELVLRIFLSRVRSHYLIHAGVVSCQDRAAIIAADSMHGKSTLTMKLVHRGFQFLSDEFAAIRRADGWVDPFPRCLRLCPDTLERVGFRQAAQNVPFWLDKTLIDIEQVQSDSLGRTAQIGHIIVLRDPIGRTDVTTNEDGRWLGIFVDRVNESFLADLKKINAIKSFQNEVSGSYPLLQIVVSSKQAALPEIEAACQKHQIRLYRVNTRKDERPSFDQTARLTEIPKSRMTMELVKRLMGGRQSELIQDELGGDPKRLFVEISALLKPARCWELTVGPLEQMADLVCGLPWDA